DDTSQFSECVQLGSSSACEYQLSSSSGQFSSNSASGSFTVTAGPTCAYSPSDPDSWVQITSGPGLGNGTVTFNLQANTATTTRQSSIAIASGVTFTIMQDGVGPDFSLSVSPPSISGSPNSVIPVMVTITRTGGFTGAVTVTAPPKADGIKLKPGSPVKLNSSTTRFSLNMKITSGAVAGTYGFTFSATGSGLTGTRTANLSVTVE
ncbi:MAG TPA: BACON domain-containing carbohydrate-binding protein, partial [Blastocatellia bacterium]